MRRRWYRPAGAHRPATTRSTPTTPLKAGRCSTGWGVDAACLPILVRFDGKVYVRPGESDILAAHRGKTTVDARRYDVAIVGGGPAGLTAAVYAASE